METAVNAIFILRLEQKKMIELNRYYKDCIRVDDEKLAEEERDYIRRTGHYYVLAEQQDEMGRVKFNTLHIMNICAFLEKCKRDKVKISCVGFKEKDYRDYNEAENKAMSCM